jgi:N-acetylneuraminate synthase
VSSCDIPIGTVLTRDLLTLKRPGTGLGPTELSRLVGRRAATDIPADTVFSWDMVT